MTSEERQTIVTMLEQDKKYDEIQAHFKANLNRNLSSATISKYGERAGVMRKKRQPARAEPSESEPTKEPETHTTTELIEDLTPPAAKTKKEAKKTTESKGDADTGPEAKVYGCGSCGSEWKDTERTATCPVCKASLE